MLLLAKYNNNNDLKLINNFNEEYFVLKVKKNETLLYLNTKILYSCLKNGITIKYRNYIFLFLKNIIQNNDNIYKFSGKLDNNIFNKIINKQELNSIFNENINFKNIEYILNITNRIIKKNNLFKLIDNNIIKLQNNLYADTKYYRFLTNKNIFNFYRFNGIIINSNIDKNRLYSLISIKYNKYNEKLNNLNYKIINTKCTLILTENSNINIWINLIKNYFKEYKICKISRKQDFKNIYNKDINNYDFLILNINFINSRYFKDYYNNYGIYQNNKFDNLIKNSLYDNLFNKNILDNNFENLYIFNWSNIIFDNIEKIKNIDKNNFIKNFKTNNVKYYLLNNNINNNILDYIINNCIYDKNNKLIGELENNDFYEFIIKELIVKENNTKNIYYNFEKVLLDENELDLYNNIVDNDDNKMNSIFLMNINKYNYYYNNIDELNNKNKLYYNNLISNEYEKKEILNNFFKNKDINDSFNIFINKYFNKTILNDNNINEFSLLDNIKENINKYNSKIVYFENIINNYENTNFVCSICIENIDKNNNLCIINCGHYFCKKCLTKYIIENCKKCKCPICRSDFLLNNVYVPILDNNINSTFINGSKLNSLKNLLKRINCEKIIIVTQYKENIELKNNFINKDKDKDEDYDFFNLFYKNNNLKIVKRNNFLKSIKKSILFCNYDEILEYKYITVNSFIFIDYPEINIINDKLKKLNSIYNDNIINLYFLYVKNTFEEIIISNIFQNK